MADDLKILKQAVADVARTTRTSVPLVYGVLDQDSDQHPSYTDAAYNASVGSIDVVFVTFLGSISRHGCTCLDVLDAFYPSGGGFPSCVLPVSRAY